VERTDLAMWAQRGCGAGRPAARVRARPVRAAPRGGSGRARTSGVHGPFTSSGLSTFCQRCRHCTSVRSEKNSAVTRTGAARSARAGGVAAQHRQASAPTKALEAEGGRLGLGRTDFLPILAVVQRHGAAQHVVLRVGSRRGVSPFKSEACRPAHSAAPGAQAGARIRLADCCAARRARHEPAWRPRRLPSLHPVTRMLVTALSAPLPESTRPWCCAARGRPRAWAARQRTRADRQAGGAHPTSGGRAAHRATSMRPAPAPRRVFSG